MGIIRRQSIKNTIVSLVAAIVGAINMLFIYEILLEPEQLGKIKYLTATAFLLVPFVMLGISQTMLRFFPRFEDREKKHHGILGFGIFYALTGYILYLLVTLICFDFLPDKFQDNYPVISGILLFAVLMTLLGAYLASLKRIVVPSIFNNLWIKIGVPILVVLYHFNFITFDELEWNLITVYAVATIGLLVYVRFMGQLFLKPNLSFLTPKLKSDIKAYTLYSTLGPMGAVLMTQIDQFMVTEILDYSDNGIYTMAVYFGSLFNIPMMSIFSIANPIISDSSDKGDADNIREIYSKSSINLLIIGLLGLMLIWINIDDIFSLMSKGDVYAQGKYVVLFLSTAKVIDMATSVNGAIIAHSKYFRFNLYAILLLGVLNIFANYFFIDSMGINGAAIATLSALTLFNLVKFLYVKKKFNMQPFTLNSVKVLLIFGVVFIVAMSFKISFDNLILSIIVRTLVVGFIFGLLIFTFKVSEDINALVQSIINKIKSWV